MRVRNLQIGTRLGGGFGLTTLLMFAIAAIGAYQLFQSGINIDSIVSKQYPQTLLVNQLKADHMDGMGTMKDILLNSGNGSQQAHISLVQQTNQFISENTDKLGNMLGASPKAQELLHDLKSTRSAYLDVQERYLELVKEDRMDEAKNLMLSEVREFGDNYLRSVELLMQYEEKIADDLGVATQQAISNALTVIMILTALSVVSAVAIAALVTQSITKPLNDAVLVAEQVAAGNIGEEVPVNRRDEIGQLLMSLNRMNSSLRQIVEDVRANAHLIANGTIILADEAEKLAARTEEQMRSLGKTTGAIEALSQTVKQNVSSAEVANRLGVQATSIAAEGGEAVTRVVDVMNVIKGSSSRIGDIIGVIDGIAFQTNILALNAAVEAARAGDQGRGFAVVASEVRSLAQRSTIAAKEIKELVTKSVEHVEEGSRQVEEAGRTMTDIVDAVKDVTKVVEQITDATLKQRADIESAVGLIRYMDEMTSENVSLVNETTSASVSMKDYAESLTKAVSVFKIERAQETVLEIKNAGLNTCATRSSSSNQSDALIEDVTDQTLGEMKKGTRTLD